LWWPTSILWCSSLSSSLSCSQISLHEIWFLRTFQSVFQQRLTLLIQSVSFYSSWWWCLSLINRVCWFVGIIVSHYWWVIQQVEGIIWIYHWAHIRCILCQHSSIFLRWIVNICLFGPQCFRLWKID